MFAFQAFHVARVLASEGPGRMARGKHGAGHPVKSPKKRGGGQRGVNLLRDLFGRVEDVGSVFEALEDLEF